ncbi:MAG TPA: AbrB/MazE/SpoVT family DNA-binding domain-containing protein [Chromatiales bacterium]|nr:AbrB/MazE/SpoVT family DNA-binding domain-containing protein [Thiotrichales bacterium]HIP69567.1 AbrB/MazE/SpoVT family DNA-binding domain-containing protein [Chromatiales bacterium]
MIATMSSKGQVTFPKAIREQLKLEAGDKVEFTITEDGQLLVIPKTAPVKKLKGMLPKPAKAVSLAKMEAAIAKGAAE